MKSMHKYSILIASFLLAFTLFSCTGPQKAEAEKKEGGKVAAKQTPEEAVKAMNPKPGIYTVIDTTLGRIVCELYPDVAPIGVENFVGLAEGTKEFTDPKTGEKTKRPYYDGLTFHRVIPDFMVQGGCPLGTGTGGPGYQFKNEISKDVKFDRPGRMAYANAGPDTNGSQFFITHRATAHLDPSPRSSYTIFGQCIQGQDVVDAMAKVDRDMRDKPKTPIVMEKVTIVRIEDKKKSE